METSTVLAIFFSLLFSAYFSGTEIAFVSANKLYFELQKKQGALSGLIIAPFFKRPSLFVATMLVGNTLSLVIYGIFMAEILDPILLAYLPSAIKNEVNLLIIQSILSTSLVLVVAEFLPKAMFRLNPDRFLEILAVPTYAIYWFLFFPVWGFVNFSKYVIVKILRLNYSEERPVFRLTDLNNYISNTIPSQEENKELKIDTEIFTNAIEFKNVKVRDCMTPRTEIVAVDISDGFEKLRKTFLETAHTKVVIYRDSMDDVIGYCHSLGLLQNPASIEEMLNEIIAIPETTVAQALMVRFISENRSIALVVDEFGGTAGIVTLEDVLEEIFGDIQDEDDDDEWAEQQIDDYNYVLSARHEIEYLNEKYHFGLPEGDYDTLGGYILFVNESIPQENDTIAAGPFTFFIQTVNYSRIEIVKLTLNKEYYEEVREKL
jgi:CBS domain containing-hemolysin-like protein